MKLVYLWIENHKDIIKNQAFNISGAYDIRYDVEYSRLHIIRNVDYMENFYGKNILDVTAIVGSNGSGKTTLSRFLYDYCEGVRPYDDEYDSDDIKHVMSVVYRFVIDSNDDGRATILATNNMLEAMGITPEQFHEDALKNAPELKPAVITGMSEVMAEMMGMSPEEMAMMGMPTDPADEQMFVATVPDKIHGAGVLAYQDFMDQAAERVGGSFYILPSSLHEVLLVPDNGQMNLQDLEAMVREVNATQVAPEDKLTDNVYHYDAEAKVFELGEKFVEREATKDSVEKSEEKSSVLGDLKAKKEEVAKQPKKDAVDKAVNKNKGGDAI